MNVCKTDYIPINNKCISCLEAGYMFYYENKCVEKCPNNYFPNNQNICNNEITCNNCLNNSTCSNNDNTITCDCNNLSYGIYCSYSEEEKLLAQESIDLLITDLLDSSDSLNSEIINIYDLIMGFNLNDLELSNLPILLFDYTERLLKNDSTKNFTETLKLVDYTLDLLIREYFNETNTIEMKDYLINLVIDSIKHNDGNLSNFTNSSIIYQGKQISIQVSADNSVESKAKSKANNLAIVDYSQCENKLKALGIIKSNETIRSVILNSKNTTNNIQGLSISTKLIDSQGNIIDESKCDSFTVLLPTQKNLQNLNQYNLVKNLSADIYNSKDNFFNDVCFGFQGSNSSDITISSRRDTFNVTMVCSENCTYGGLDSDFYTICDCLSIDHSYNLVKSSIFDPVTTNNLA